MTEKLQAAIREAEALPPEEQDEVAEALVIILDELGWNTRFADPANQAKMQQMGDAALREHAAGQTEPWP